MLYDKYETDDGPMLELHGVLHHLVVNQTKPFYGYEDGNAAFVTINWEHSATLDQEDINELAEFFGRLANGPAKAVSGE